MKKNAILLLIISLTLSGCSDVINKKPSVKTAKDDITKIKEKYKNDYSEEDFETLTDKIAGNVLKGAFTDEKLSEIKFEKTYKEYLDEAKKQRLEKEELALKIQKEEKAKKDMINKAITITMYGKEYIPENYDVGRYEDYNLFKYAIQNKVNKEIKAIGISFKVYNALGEPIGEGYQMDFTDDRIAPNSNYKGNAAFSFNQFNNADNSLKNAKFEDLTFDFSISKIVYTDGSVLE